MRRDWLRPGASELLAGWYRNFPLSFKGGIPGAAARRGSPRWSYFCRPAKEESGQGVGQLSGLSWRGAEQVPATCLLLENTGPLHPGRLSRGKLLRARESPAKLDTWRIRRGPSIFLVYFFGLFVYSFILVFNACSARGHLCKLLILIYQTLYYCTVALGYADIVPTRSKSMELLIPGIFIAPQRCNVQVPAARMCLRYTCTAQRPSL